MRARCATRCHRRVMRRSLAARSMGIREALRHEGIRTPVLVLSALRAVDDRVRGLRAGGDDYLTKPFATVELIARIEALMRWPADSRDTVLRVGPLELDSSSAPPSAATARSICCRANFACLNI